MAWSLAAKKPKIKVCIPHFGNVSLEWAQSVLAPIQSVPHPNFDKETMFMRGILNLDTERNALAATAIKDPSVTHVLWVDTDMVPEQPPNINEAINILLNCNYPIVSGLYRAKQQEGYNYAAWLKNPSGNGNGYIPVVSWTENSNWIKADVVGFGFVLVQRQVFEKIPPPWFDWSGFPGPSEDFTFCEKAHKYGFDVFVMTDVRLSHIGTLKVKSDGKITTLGV